MEYSGFFASVGGDRNYDMAFLAKWISSIIGNGVYSGNLAVAAGTAMTITIPAGQGWINGYYYQNNSTLTLSIAAADGILNRIDTVVLRWDVNTRSITAQVLKGTAASSPVAPSIVRSVEQYDLKLAEISIPAGTIVITGGLITDTRLITSVCGIVTGVVSQVDSTTLYNQIQSDLATFQSTSQTGFTTWFNTIKGQLTTDAAGSLQTQINNLPLATASINGLLSSSGFTKLSGIAASADVTSATNVGTSIYNSTAKTTPVDADVVAIIDSAASNVLKKLSWVNIKATLKTYFDTLYSAAFGNPSTDGYFLSSTAAGVRSWKSILYPRLTTGTTLSPETQYDLGTYTSALSVTLSAPVDTTVTHEFCFAFKTGASGYSLAITIPTTTPTGTLKWMGGTAPTLAASKSYQVNIKYFNNGTVIEWHATAAQYG